MKRKKQRSRETDNAAPAKETPYELINALAEETANVVKFLSASKSEFGQRLFVRQFGSEIDAWAFIFQHRARESADTEGVELTNDEQKLLRVGAGFDEEDRLRPAFSNIRKNFLFGIKVFARVRGVPPFAEQLPSAFDVVIPLRNRLTHPKRASDLRVTPEELKATAEAIKWFVEMTRWGRTEEVAYIDRVRWRINESIDRQIAEISEDQERRAKISTPDV